ncbi:MAG: glycosyltransferase family protein [bacterium]|nr:glycosyltransferase family protein [bacterium]
MMKIGAIIQARMESERLPGKVLMDIEGHPMLWHIIERLKRISTLDILVVATSYKNNKGILDVARKCGIEYFVGEEDDVLKRYIDASKRFNIDPIVRATGDNPLLAIEVVDRMVHHHIETSADCTTMDVLPLGLGTEVLSIKALIKTHSCLEKTHYHREHVSTFIHERPDMFRLEILETEPYLRRPELRLTVDTIEDLTLIREIYRRLYKEGEIIDISEVINLLDKRKELLEINAHIRQKGIAK